MIEEKTKEPMQEAPSAPPVKHKRTLRSLWAQLQCSRLLRKHRFRRKTQRHMNDLSQKLRGSALVLRVGETLYALGFAAEYAVVRTGRNISAIARWLAQSIRNVFHELAALAFPGAAQMFRDLFGPVILFFRGTGALLVHARAVRKEKGFGAAVKASVHYLTSGIRRNLRLLPRMAMYILPVCMLAVFVTVYDRTIQQPYALAVHAPEVQPTPVAEPVTSPEPVVVQPEKSPLPECKISVSCNDLSFELVSCEGNETAESIRVYARFTNTGVTNNSATIRMTSAIDPDGATFTNFSQIETNGCTSWTYGNKMPKGVRIGKVFEIKGVSTPCATLSYVEMTVDNCKVIIHNLPVDWK